MVQEVKRFSDIQPSQLTCDEKVNVEAILDTDLVFQDFSLLIGDKGEFAWIIAEDPESKKVLGFSTGSKVVLRKLKEAKDKGYLPLTGKIVRVKRYYDII
jgi:hypothetical protein